jgi:hypothetical protein
MAAAAKKAALWRGGEEEKWLKMSNESPAGEIKA